jgi:hypothetical protein
MRAILAAIVIVAASAPHARANWEYTKWGMTPEQVVGASKGAVKIVPAADRYKDDEHEIAAQGSHNDGPLHLDVGFMFDNKGGGLTCVLYNATGEDAAVLKAILIKRYGPPTKEGSFLSSQTLEWKTPDEIGFVMGQTPVADVVTHCAP